MVPGEDSHKIVCVYTSFTVLFEIWNESNLFSSTVLHTYRWNEKIVHSTDKIDSLCIVDTHSNYHLISDKNNTLVLFDYQCGDPKEIIHSADIESAAGIQLSNPSICKIAFGPSGANRPSEPSGPNGANRFSEPNGCVFAVLFPNLCCIINVDSPARYTFLTISDYSHHSESASPNPQFRSFAFASDHSILILTDSEVFLWNRSASKTSISHLLRTDADYESLRLSEDKTIMELQCPTKLTVYSMKKEMADQNVPVLLVLEPEKTKKFITDSFYDFDKKYALIGRLVEHRLICSCQSRKSRPLSVPE